jgi:flagellar biosynthesis chaperone FliJ
MMINEEELKEIQEEILFWNRTFDNISNRLHKLYKEKREVEGKLKNVRIGGLNLAFYSPDYYDYISDKTRVIRTYEEKLAYLNEQIDYFDKVMLYMKDEMNKLYAKARMLLV